MWNSKANRKHYSRRVAVAETAQLSRRLLLLRLYQLPQFHKLKRISPPLKFLLLRFLFQMILQEAINNLQSCSRKQKGAASA